MTRIANHFIKRDPTNDDRGMFSTSWAYTSNMDPNLDRLAWQYHTNARLMSGDKAVREEVHEHAPNWQEYSPISTTRVEHNHCLSPEKYWPNTPWVALASLMDAYVNYGHRNGWNGEQSVAWFRFEEPVTPKVTPSRSGAVLSWAIDALKSQMGMSSKSDQCRLRWYVQRAEKGSDYPKVLRYDTSGFGTQTSGNYNNAPKGFKGAYKESRTQQSGSATVTFTEHSVTPDVPVKIRLVSYNDGFCGASKPYTNEHIFAKPNKPSITQRLPLGANDVFFATNANQDPWHPVDKMQLQRLTASVCDPNSSSWVNVGNAITDSAAIALTQNVNDSQPGRIPPTDKATWYRVITEHDDPANVGVSNIWPSSYIAKPSAPTITNCTLQANHTVQMSVNRNSSMTVETYLEVTDVSKDTPKVVVPAYRLDGDLTTGFLVQSNGQPMYFDVSHVYRIDVYNRVVNVAGAAAPYAVDGDVTKSLPSSDLTSTEVRGSIGAVAKSALGRVTIDSVTTTSGGKGVKVEWHAEPDMLSITYDDVGTIVEWTDADGGWLSTEKPRDYKLSDGGNDDEEEGEGEGTRTGAVVIDNLTEGKTYQIRLRRYVTLDSKDGYGPETTTSVTPWSTPSQVTLQAPAYVRPGESVRYSWTFTDEGDTPQSAAQLTVNGVPYAVEGSAGSFVLDVPDSLAGEVLAASVRVACNGGYSDPSEQVSTTVAEPPTCSAELAGAIDDTQGYMGNTLTALPLSLTVGGSGDTYRATVTSAGGARSPEPVGGRELAAGEVAVAAVLPGTGTHELDGSMVIGGGSYDVEVVAVDTATGMESEPVTLGFSVEWDEPAAIPSGTVTIADGVATITPAQGEDAPEGETCRIWRKVADGYALACEDAAWDAAHTDRVPAYGGDALAYVIEAVSPDGDHRWTEVPYTLAGEDVRITYGGGEVSLPWNLVPSGTYAKSFERRSHMDGHRAGFWEPGVDRDWTCSAGVVKDGELVDVLREVGRHDGLCYVRGPRGVAFAANVDVSLGASYDSAAVSVDLTCAEVADDGTYAVARAPEQGGE